MLTKTEYNGTIILTSGWSYKMRLNPANRKKRIITLVAILCFFLLLFFVIIPSVLCYTIYNSAFDVRFETYAPTAFRLSDFEGLQRTRYTFASDKQQQLVGYKYFTADTVPVGMVVVAHGFGGGGHVSYMDCISYFAHHGFWVFAFDATGNDESEGNVGGLPQMVADLDSALNFVQSKFPQLPIVLFGHSWGGYAVSAVLNLHPEVKAVCEFAGFNKSGELLRSECEGGLGGYASIVMPYVNLYESFKFKKFAKYSALDGFANTSAKIIVVHSKDDDVIPFDDNAALYLQKYQNDPRFEFVISENKGHSNILYSQSGIDYLAEINGKLANYVEGLDGELTAELKEKWIKENLDRTRWANMLNYELFDKIADIFTQAVNAQ